MKVEPITCQLRALADHILTNKCTAADLRNIAVEMADTRAVIETEILRLDGVEKAGARALRQLLGAPEGGAA